MVGASSLFLVLSLVGGSYAHIGQGCGGHQVNKRNVGGPLREYVPRQTTAASPAPTDVASAAESVDPAVECTPYSYQPVLDVKANYPAIWETATLLPADTEAQSIFATINATVNSKFPNISPRGVGHMGDFSNSNYTSADPDCWWTWRQCTTPASDTGLVADITTMPEPNTWGFGFDDGPNCSHNALYDMLMEDNQKATMFYIGSNVMDWPLQAKRGIDDGHQICVHTWSHQYMTSFSNEDAFAELYYTQKIIKDILGVTPQCWRPPYGDVDNRIRAIAAGLNLTTIVWSEDSEDWRANTGNVTEADIDQNYEGFIAQAKNGTFATYGPIILNHELNNFTMQEMVKYYSQIKDAFTHLVPIATGYNITHPYAETNITYPDFAQYISGKENVTTGGSSDSSSSSSSASTTGAGAASSKSSGSASSTPAAGAADADTNNANTSATGAAAPSFQVGSWLAVVMSVFGMAAML